MPDRIPCMADPRKATKLARWMARNTRMVIRLRIENVTDTKRER